MTQSDNRPKLHDMVVPLLSLPEAVPSVDQLKQRNIVVRRAQTMEVTKVCDFVQEHWPYWRDSIGTAFGASPVRVFIATHQGDIVGFAAYDIDYRGFFGPTGVAPDRQGAGIGKALLLRCLSAMREAGYLYAIIGAVGPAEFYTRACGAISLPTDWPNYTDGHIS